MSALEDTLDFDVPAEVWPNLNAALEGVGHYWVFNGRFDEITCNDCVWHAEASFLVAVKLADQHRREVKANVLRALLGTLGPVTNGEP